MGVLEDIKKFYTKGGAKEKILFVNAFVFLIIQVGLLLVYFFDKEAAGRFFAGGTFLSSTSDLARLIQKPWSIVTHMFTHLEILHFIFNMLVFYFAGGLFVMFFSQRELWKVYILGGLSGFLLFVLSYNLFPVFSAVNSLTTICGASASVMAILMAAALTDAKRKVKLFGIIEVEILWLALGLVLLDLVSIRSGNNSGGHIGHLGGAIFGFLFVQAKKNRKDMTLWMDRIFDWIKDLFGGSGKTPRDKKSFVSDEDFNLRKKANQKRVDIILDKISRGGYESLSKEEKEFLFKHSQK